MPKYFIIKVQGDTGFASRRPHCVTLGLGKVILLTPTTVSGVKHTIPLSEWNASQGSVSCDEPFHEIPRLNWPAVVDEYTASAPCSQL